jgi:hypothetical protein
MSAAVNTSKTLLLVGLVLGCTVSAKPQSSSKPALDRKSEKAAASLYVGSGTCARCHSQISQSYSKTAMALTSGPAADNLFPGSFAHDRSRITYRVYKAGPAAYLAYDRPGDPTTHGTRELKYYVGSGTRGRSYLFSVDGFVFQSPVNYYTQPGAWDMAPGYQMVTEAPMNRAIDPTCLYCHASRVQQPVPGTQNRFSGDPFLENGVGCERCHGPGGAHVERKGRMVNPLALAPDRRDSVCAQCHIEAEAVIEKAGRDMSDFRPGDRLSDYKSFFVYANGAQHLTAVSHVEALAQSVCKQHSGDKLSCLTCHDPHTIVPPADRASYYRSKCLGCHTGQRYASQHRGTNPDCIACHMQKDLSRNIAHTTVTDHRILRKPKLPNTGAPSDKLVEFGTDSPDPRDLGLAYGQIAELGNAYAASESLRLLQTIIPSYPNDVEVLTRLAYLYQQKGELARARELYERAVRQGPSRPVAANNLGVLYASTGQESRVLSLWRETFKNSPWQGELGVNFAIVLLRRGERAEARAVLERALLFNPDLTRAKALLRELGPDGPRIR